MEARLSEIAPALKPNRAAAGGERAAV